MLVKGALQNARGDKTNVCTDATETLTAQFSTLGQSAVGMDVKTQQLQQQLQRSHRNMVRHVKHIGTVKKWAGVNNSNVRRATRSRPNKTAISSQLEVCKSAFGIRVLASRRQATQLVEIGTRMATVVATAVATAVATVEATAVAMVVATVETTVVVEARQERECCFLKTCPKTPDIYHGLTVRFPTANADMRFATFLKYAAFNSCYLPICLTCPCDSLCDIGCDGCELAVIRSMTHLISQTIVQI